MAVESYNPLDRYPFYPKACLLYEDAMQDTEKRIRDERWWILVKQLVRSSGSICANIEEGYGRGTPQEFAHRLKLARGEAWETRGWYHRSKRFLPLELVTIRKKQADEIIALLTATINTLEKKSGRQS